MLGSNRNRAMLLATVAGLAVGTTFAQTQSATPATPANPVATPASPANPTTTPASPANRVATPAAPARPMAATPTPSANAGLSGSPIQMPGTVPSKSETTASAFEKLSASQRYVTRDEVGKLDGFDRAFTEADRDKDGQLNQEEFAVAWAIYTGRT
jgi:hypothetical protein